VNGVDNFPMKILPACGLSGNIPSVKQGMTNAAKNSAGTFCALFWRAFYQRRHPSGFSHSIPSFFDTGLSPKNFRFITRCRATLAIQLIHD
jgi:hypothetical protein